LSARGRKKKNVISPAIWKGEGGFNNLQLSVDVLAA